MVETPVLCLNMIVRNEGAILERCLESVAPFIGAYVIVDTGSTDDTKEVITRILGLVHDVPGEIHDAPFEDFSQARNAALDAAEKSPLPFTHMLLVDADMQLCADGDADVIAAALQSLDPTADSFLVPQIMGALRYHNVRIVRRGAGARYMGKTHEYLSIPRGWPRPQLDSIHFHDFANGANRPEKYARDERLLLATLAESPNDERSHYYLGQTYREMGRPEAALGHYRTRATIGGWEDEGWHAEFMAALCLAELGREDEAVATALRAYQRRPRRLEPLHWLAKRYREKGQNHLALLFAQAGVGVPAPMDETLFLDTYPYNGGFLEEISIAGFYGNPLQRTQGLRACQRLSRDRDVPEHVRNTARSNLVHYAQPLQALAGGRRFQLNVAPWVEESAYNDAGTPRFTPSTPSVAWIPNSKGGRRLASTIRWLNYRLFPSPTGGSYQSNDEDGVVRSETDIVILNPETLEIVERKRVVEGCAIQRTGFSVTGFEDLRLFSHKGTVYATATTREHSADAHAEIALLTLLETPSVWQIVACEVLPRTQPGAYEKNWMPVLSDKGLPKFMAWVDPPTILSFHERSWKVDAALPFSMSDARGGGQILRLALRRPREFQASYLGIVHRAQTAPDGTRSYTHSFVGFGENLHATLESPPFVFQQGGGLEFAAGLAEVGDDLLVSYHRLDSEAWIHRVPFEAVLNTLSPIRVSP